MGVERVVIIRPRTVPAASGLVIGVAAVLWESYTARQAPVLQPTH